MTEHDSDASGDDASDERRLFGERREETTLLVGSELGVTRVEVAAARVGQFSLIDRRPVRSIAADRGLVVAGTDDAVLVSTGGSFEPVGFGPARAVGVDGSWLYAAGPDGRVGRLDRDSPATSEWETAGTAPGPRAFDGDLLAAEGGVYRAGSTLDALGLEAVRDVAGPYAATGEGIYRRQDGEWVAEHAGEATAVAADGNRAHAVVDGTLFERTGGSWDTLDAPGRPRLLAYCETLSVLSADGTVSVLADPATSHDGHGGWRSQALGVREPTGVAVLDGR